MVTFWKYINERPKCETKLNDGDSPVDNFLNNTSITALTLILRQRRWVSKLIWLIVTLSSLAMATYQSIGLINDFMECKIRESREYLSQQFAPFPSVTVCDINPVNWNYLKKTNHSLYYELINSNSKDSEKLTLILMRSLLRMSPADRQYLYNQSSPFIPTAILPHKNVTPGHITFRDTYLGQCATFLPDLYEPAIGLLGLCNHFSMHITVPINVEERIPYLHPNKVAYLIIHPRGSPPALRLEKVIRLSPFDKVTVKADQYLTVIDSNDRNRTDMLTCIENEKAMVKSGTIFDGPGRRKYGYSSIGCMYKKIQKQGLDNGCIDIFTPLENVNISHIDDIKLCLGDDPLKFEPKDCPPLCQEIDVSSTYSRWSKIIDEQIKKRIKYPYFKFDSIYEDEASMFDEEIYGEFNSTSMDPVIAVYQTKGYYKISKMGVTSLADMVGMIGGNVGLWLGISMLSLWEVIELGCTLVYNKCKKKIQPKTHFDDIPCKNNIVHVLQYEPTANFVKPSSAIIQIEST